MIIAVIILAFTTIFLLLVLIRYRLQVKRLAQHMKFINENNTKMLLTSNSDDKELNLLTDEINRSVERVYKAERQFHIREESVKDTITSLSHDIRTPLTSLDGYFQLLEKAENDDERKLYYDVIQNRICSLKSMLEELFTYTRLENEAYTIQTEPIDFTDCVCKSLFTFYTDFKRTGVTPVTDFENKEIFINGNTEAVQRIIQNIIKNVLEHGCKEVRFELKPVDSQVVFICSNKVDNPENIDVSQIFTRFYKADPVRTHTSTGLGLTIAKGLAERMGGTVSAEITDDIFSIIVVFDTVTINKESHDMLI